LDSPLEASIKDLSNGPGAVSLGFFFSLSHRLGSVMPMEEALGHIKVHYSMHDLSHFSHEFSIFSGVLLDSLKGSPHEFAIPLFHQFNGSSAHIKSDLDSFEPFPESFSFFDVIFVATHNLFLDSEFFHHFDGANH
jgi:hypothetical protein